MFCNGAAPTLDDQGDADDGPAELNYPILSSTATGVASPAFLSVQGETLLSELEVRTSADGIADFSAIIPANLTVTATATQLAEDGRPLCTSEFSQAVKSGKP